MVGWVERPAWSWISAIEVKLWFVWQPLSYEVSAVTIILILDFTAKRTMSDLCFWNHHDFLSINLLWPAWTFLERGSVPAFLSQYLPKKWSSTTVVFCGFFFFLWQVAHSIIWCSGLGIAYGAFCQRLFFEWGVFLILGGCCLQSPVDAVFFFLGGEFTVWQGCVYLYVSRGKELYICVCVVGVRVWGTRVLFNWRGK